MLYKQDISDEVLAEITEAQIGLNLEADKEELFWEQRARVNWLKNGDRNNNFFHKVAVQHHLRGRIMKLQDDNGRPVNSNEDFVQIASNFFNKLFTASNVESDDRLFGLVEERVTKSMNEELLQEFIEDEIVQAIKQMAPLKAPGVDRFYAVFFQWYWHIVGPEVSKFYLAVLNGETEFGEKIKHAFFLFQKLISQMI